MATKVDLSRLRRPEGLTPEHILVAAPGHTDAVLIDCFGRSFQLRRRMRVGRDPHAVDLVILDEAVSSRHAELVLGAAGWAVLDQGSMNGTFVEGARVAGGQPLSDEDVVAFADVSFLFLEKQP